MPIPLVNSIASWFLKKRMHQIELFVKYPNEVQNDVLSKLIVNGISKAMAIGELSPGKAPTSTPIKTPPKIKARFCTSINN